MGEITIRQRQLSVTRINISRLLFSVILCIQLLRDAFPFEASHKYLIFDRNQKFGFEVLDGVHVICTSESKENLLAPDVVWHYKNLINMERAFRRWNGIDIRVRLINLHTEEHVWAHTFLCLLAHYVESHMRTALVPLLIEEEELVKHRHQWEPVAPAESSAAVQVKKQRK